MTCPQPGPYRPETPILSLGGDFYDPVRAADFPRTVLRFRNDRWAAAVGLDGLGDREWIDHFGRFRPLADNLAKPLALRYHGHQFRVYNPDIGDGRGFLFAQLRDSANRLLDLGTKGSGRTPYSRFGDGRLTLKGAVRELLATEMLEALGVDTSKTFSIVETGEALERGDEPSPTRSAVLVRLSHGHIRIGSFQRLAFLGQSDNLRRLASYSLQFYHGEQADPAEAPVRLLDRVSEATARLAASYIAAGFVHGVLNSDNIAISGESFDYGPWRWAPTWDGHFTAAYFDHAGLYAFGRQPEAIHWDLLQLALSFRDLCGTERLTPALQAFPDRFQRSLRDSLFRRLGIAPAEMEADMRLVGALETALSKRTVGVDRFFFDWRGGSLRAGTPAAAAYEAEEFAALRDELGKRAPLPGAVDHPYWSDSEPCSMLIDEVEAIWAAIDKDDDWTRLEEKVGSVRRMGEAMRAVERRQAGA